MKIALTARDKFELRELRESGVSVKDCASYKNVSVATAMRALAELRQKMGQEKFPVRRRQLARNRIAMSQRTTSESGSH